MSLFLTFRHVPIFWVFIPFYILLHSCTYFTSFVFLFLFEIPCHNFIQAKIAMSSSVLHHFMPVSIFSSVPPPLFDLSSFLDQSLRIRTSGLVSKADTTQHVKLATRFPENFQRHVEIPARLFTGEWK